MWYRVQLTEEEIFELCKIIDDIKNGEYEKATYVSNNKHITVDGSDGINRYIYIWEQYYADT